MSARLRVVVIDMQPITPAVGGGRQRLLGLYHGLGEGIDCTYVGSYDWPGEPYRDLQLTPGLREIVVPLSPAHHEAATRLGHSLGGATVIDAAFPDHAALSPEYARVAGEHIAGADVVVFTHPWCFPALAHLLRPEQLVVHDSQNVETLLKTEALDHLPGAEPLLRLVAASEQAVIERSQLVLACSQEDAAMYTRVFDLSPAKLRVAPNGAFTERFTGAEDLDRISPREALGLPADQPVAIFLGSLYGPNVEAARYIATQLAPACPGVHFVIAGGVGQALVDLPRRDNLLVTGTVDEAVRDGLLLAADVALNPMDAGSGTNVKMFDYMAAALPVLCTEIGARGIGTLAASPEGVVVAPLQDFPSRLPQLLEALEARPSLRRCVRDTVCARFSWERISAELGQLLRRAHARHRRGRSPGRVAMLSTWNISCGIGEHSAHLADAFEAEGFEPLVLGNDPAGHEPLGFERELHHPVTRAWHWDNQHWRDSRIDIGQIKRVLSLARPDMLLVQHHSAFLPDYDVGETLRCAREAGVPVLVEMHDGRKLSVARKQAMVDLGATLVAHHADELVGLAARGKAQVLPLPLLVPSLPDAPPPGGGDGPVLAGFGFLRPYKGVMATIRTVAKLRQRYPGLRYRGWHALYPGSESESHLQDCLREAEALGIADAIEIDTFFHPTAHVVASLAAADLVLMPYQPSEEGASAAVNLALSAGRPVLVSPSAIFRPVASVVAVADGFEVPDYVKAVANLLDDPARAAALAAGARRWVGENSYPRAARRLAELAGLASAETPTKGERHG